MESNSHKETINSREQEVIKKIMKKKKIKKEKI